MKAAVIPKFVSAKTPQALERAMLERQMRLQRKLHWFNIVWDGKRWVAWYEDNYGGSNG